MDSHLVQASANVVASATSSANGSGLIAGFGWQQAWQSCVMVVALVSAAMNSLHRVSVRSHDAGIPVVSAARLPTAVVETRSIIPEFKLNGTITASEQSTVYAETGGRIAEIFVKDGDTIECGCQLLRLSNPDLENKLHEAQRGVVAAKRELARLDLRFDQDSMESQVALVQSRNAYNEALRTYENDVELFKLGFIARQKLRLSQEREERTRLSFEAFVQREATKKKSNKLLLEERQTQLQLSQQRLAEVQSEIDALVVTAQTHGVLDLSSSQGAWEVGQQIAAWSRVGQIFRPAALQVQCSLTDHQAEEIEIGQVAVLKFNGREYPAPIESLFREENQQVAVVNLPLAIAAQARPQQIVHATIQGRLRDSATVIEASQMDVASYTTQEVYRVENGRATRVPVTWGPSNAQGCCVVKGLVAGDVIIAANIDHLVGAAAIFRIEGMGPNTQAAN